MLKKVEKRAPTALAVKIAREQQSKDPHAHDWRRQSNRTMKCSKCGEVELGLASIGRQTKCSIRDDDLIN